MVVPVDVGTVLIYSVVRIRLDSEVVVVVVIFSVVRNRVVRLAVGEVVVIASVMIIRTDFDVVVAIIEAVDRTTSSKNVRINIIGINDARYC